MAAGGSSVGTNHTSISAIAALSIDSDLNEVADMEAPKYSCNS